MDMKSPLPARPLQKIAQFLVMPLYIVVTSALAIVASVEWVEFTRPAQRSVNVCWFVLMSVRSVAACHVHRVPRSVKIVASTANAIKLVESHAFLVVTRVRGNVSITNAASSATRFVTGADATSPALKSCHATTFAAV